MGFMMHESYWDALKSLDGQERLELLDVMCGFVFEEKDPEDTEMSPLVKMAWLLIKPNIEVSMMRSRNGAKGGRGNKKQEDKTAKKPALKHGKKPALKPNENSFEASFESRRGEERRGESKNPLKGFYSLSEKNVDENEREEILPSPVRCECGDSMYQQTDNSYLCFSCGSVVNVKDGNESEVEVL